MCSYLECRVKQSICSWHNGRIARRASEDKHTSAKHPLNPTLKRHASSTRLLYYPCIRAFAAISPSLSWFHLLSTKLPAKLATKWRLRPIPTVYCHCLLPTAYCHCLLPLPTATGARRAGGRWRARGGNPPRCARCLPRGRSSDASRAGAAASSRAACAACRRDAWRPT